MIFQKEFYFVRHGQTDQNVEEKKKKNNFPEDIPLNDTGRNQAASIKPIISSLGLHTVCSSPLSRAKETKQIITTNLPVTHHEIHDLSECSSDILNEMSQLGMCSSLPKEGVVWQFMNRVRNGINQALSLDGTILVVAHGGVHWAICYLLGIEDHSWAIDNCVPVHFIIGNDGKWVAKK